MDPESMDGKMRSCTRTYPVPVLRKGFGLLCSHLVECCNPFIAVDHIKVEGKESTSFHAHTGVQMITYFVDGAFKTESSMWSYPILGLTRFDADFYHMETPVTDANHSSAELFKVWIPYEHSTSIQYSQCFSQFYTLDDVTILREEDNSAELRVLSGSTSGIFGPIETDPPVCFFDLYLKQSSPNVLIAYLCL
ncbi:unnamed protein product, partial [Heterobilharzia americana]